MHHYPMMILADIGGTHARFAQLNGEEITHVDKYKAADYGSFEDAMRAYYASSGAAHSTPIYIATAAYPDHEDIWRFVNRNKWAIDPQALNKAGWKITHILNDFEAAAWALADIDNSARHVIQKGVNNTEHPLCLLGPGTGLGLAYFMPGQSSYVQKTHGGHMLATCISPEQRDVTTAIQRLYDMNSPLVFEQLVSGPGLLNIYNAVLSLSGEDKLATKTQEVLAAIDTEHAQNGVRLFHEFLGLFVHNVVTTGHAYGGVYLTGGVTQRLHEAGLFDAAAFHKFFLPGNVASVQSALENTPIHIVSDPYLTLSGLRSMLARQS